MSEVAYSAPCARTSSTCQSYATNSAVRPLGSRVAFGICRDGRSKSSYEAIWSQFPSKVLFNEDPATHKRCDGCSFCDGCWMWFSERHKTLERLKRLPKALWMMLKVQCSPHAQNQSEWLPMIFTLPRRSTRWTRFWEASSKLPRIINFISLMQRQIKRKRRRERGKTKQKTCRAEVDLINWGGHSWFGGITLKRVPFVSFHNHLWLMQKDIRINHFGVMRFVFSQHHDVGF